MKKATNPLALDLRAGGFEVFPLAEIFDLPSNVWYPSILIRENLLAEPFAAWAANVFYTLGGVQVLQWTDAAFFYAPTGHWLRPHHFVQRLTPAKLQAIISRVIRNVLKANPNLVKKPKDAPPYPIARLRALLISNLPSRIFAVARLVERRVNNFFFPDLVSSSLWTGSEVFVSFMSPCDFVDIQYV